MAAAKRTAEIIPLCHTLNLSDVNVELSQRDRGVEVTATVVARSLDARSIYDARFTAEEMRTQQERRRPARV